MRGGGGMSVSDSNSPVQNATIRFGRSALASFILTSASEQTTGTSHHKTRKLCLTTGLGLNSTRARVDGFTLGPPEGAPPSAWHGMAWHDATRC